MTGILTKRMEDVGMDDINALIDTRVSEGQMIEFKRGVPESKGAVGAWAEDRKLGDRAKETILEEVVAFANAHGGALILGIAEDGGPPAIAYDIAPIQDCADLADRLKLVFRDSVAPQLPRIEVKAVETGVDAGVVVLRTPPSRLAPHRVESSRNCTVRREDRCERLTMREIQDLTLNVSRGLQRLEESLATRQHAFETLMERWVFASYCFGFRITAVPIGQDLPIDRVALDGSIDGRFAPPDIRVLKTAPGSNPSGDDIFGMDRAYGLDPRDWRLGLRSVKAEEIKTKPDSKGERRASLEMGSSGAIELILASKMAPSTRNPRDFTYRQLVNTVPVFEFARVCMWADTVRNAASSPGAEYAITVQTHASGGVSLVQSGSRPSNNLPHDDSIHLTNAVFPPYELGPTTDIGLLCAQFEWDFWSAIGQDVAKRQGNTTVVRI